MILPIQVKLLYAPANSLAPKVDGAEADASIVELTDQLAMNRVHAAWWKDKSINASAAANEIDRLWLWDQNTVDYEMIAAED